MPGPKAGEASLNSAARSSGGSDRPRRGRPPASPCPALRRPHGESSETQAAQRTGPGRPLPHLAPRRARRPPPLAPAGWPASSAWLRPKRPFLSPPAREHYRRAGRLARTRGEGRRRRAPASGREWTENGGLAGRFERGLPVVELHRPCRSNTTSPASEAEAGDVENAPRVGFEPTTP